MINFKSNKWESRDPETRKSALDSITDSNIIKEIALHDEVASVRQAAIRKIKELQLLDEIIQQETDFDVKTYALERFKQLLTGHKHSELSLQSRLQWLERINHDLIEACAVDAQEPELRTKAIAKIERESLLGDIAIKDPVRELRLQAATKLSQKSTLKRVYDAVHTKDKQVAQIVKQKLAEITETEELPAKAKSEAEQICVKLEAFGRRNTSTTWQQEYAEYNRLAERWQNIAQLVDAELQTKYQQAVQNFLAAYSEYEQQRSMLEAQEAELSPIRQQKQQLISQLEGILAELENPDNFLKEELISQLNQGIEEIHTQWHNSPNLPDDEEKSYQQQYQKLALACKNILAQIANYQQYSAELGVILAKASSLLRHKNNPKTQFEQLKHEFKKLQPQLPNQSHFNDLQQRLDSQFAHIQERITKREGELQQKSQDMQSKLKTAEKLLDSGELHKTMPLEKQVRKTLSRLKEMMPDKSYKDAEARLNKISSKIRELHDWERWHDSAERVKLLQQMQELAANPIDDPEEAAKLVREAQNAWKNLGTKTYPKEEWEQFNQACNQAYEPARHYFELQAQQRQQNFVHKQELCAELEKFVHSIDWQQPNWKDIHKHVSDFEAKWYSIGPTDRKQKKPLQERFNNAIEDVKQKMNAESTANFNMRCGLIEQVEKILQSKHITLASEQKTDIKPQELTKAIEKVKEIQKEWKVTVPKERRKEQHLWDKFRQLCDTVFEFRKLQKHEREQILERNLQRKKEVCQHLTDLVQNEQLPLTELKQEVKNIRAEWLDIGKLPKESGDEVQKKYDKAMAEANARLISLEIQKQRQHIDLLHEYAKLCAKLEHSQEVTDREKLITETQTAWQALPKLQDGKIAKAIQRRFDKAIKMASSGQFNYTPEALTARRQYCIHLEILAGIESPPEDAKIKMEYQVMRLAQAMQGAYSESQDKLLEAQDIEVSFYTQAAISPQDAAKLNQRLLKAINALKQQKLSKS
jgi:DNA repair protein SbcC/Rad50